MAINDVLPLKAARRDAVAKWKCFWGPRLQRCNFDGHIYIHYAAPRHVIRLESAPFISSHAVSRFIQKIFAMKSRSRRKTEQMQKFCGPQFFWEGRGSDFSTAVCLGDLLSITWIAPPYLQ